jgi:hypothetical protein
MVPAGRSTLYETPINPRIDAPFIIADIIQRDELKDLSHALPDRSSLRG